MIRITRSLVFLPICSSKVFDEEKSGDTAILKED